MTDQEIAALRADCDRLQDENSELGRMVDRLENRLADETSGAGARQRALEEALEAFAGAEIGNIDAAKAGIRICEEALERPGGGKLARQLAARRAPDYWANR
jgi:hypothetical protein